jgi:hypothetical protein
VLLPYPIFDQLLEFSDSLEKLLSFGVAGHMGDVVVQGVALPPTGIEVIGKIGAGRPKAHQFQRLERRLMVARAKGRPLAGTGDRHLRQLEGSVVRGGKGTVGGKAGERGILEVPLNDRPEVIKLLPAGGMFSDPVTCQELPPGHALAP